MFALRQFEDVPLVALRLAVTAIFLVHGWPKMVNGRQLATELAGKPELAGLMTFIGIAEVAGAVGVGVGFLSQLAALGLAVIMAGAIGVKLKSRRGFAPRTEAGTGWSYDAMILAGLLALVFSGPGRFAVDRLLFRG